MTTCEAQTLRVSTAIGDRFDRSNELPAFPLQLESLSAPIVQGRSQSWVHRFGLYTGGDMLFGGGSSVRPKRKRDRCYLFSQGAGAAPSNGNDDISAIAAAVHIVDLFVSRTGNGSTLWRKKA